MSNFSQNQSYCFCTIALGHQYVQMAQNLAHDLSLYSPHSLLYVFTPTPGAFKQQKNVLAFAYKQQSIQRCSNDRRLLLEKALEDFPTVIHIDADTRILKPLPTEIETPPGMLAIHKDLIPHITTYRPHHLGLIKTIAQKLDIPLTGSQWIGEALYIITKDGGNVQEFFRIWEKVAKYAELHGMHGGDGNLMGLAAAKVGWTVQSNASLETLIQFTEHYDASHSVQRSAWEEFQRRLGYHYRLNKARLLALQDFDFYYGS